MVFCQKPTFGGGYLSMCSSLASSDMYSSAPLPLIFCFLLQITLVVKACQVFSLLFSLFFTFCFDLKLLLYFFKQRNIHPLTMIGKKCLNFLYDNVEIVNALIKVRLNTTSKKRCAFAHLFFYGLLEFDDPLLLFSFDLSNGSLLFGFESSILF